LIRPVIEISEADLKHIRQRLGELKDEAPSAMASALNRTANRMKKKAAELAGAGYNITEEDVKATMKVRRASKQKLAAAVVSKGPVISLSKFQVDPDWAVAKGRPAPSVYKASVRKGPATKPLDKNPKAFIAVMKSGHKGVFARTGRWKAAEGNISWKKRTREYNRSRGQKRHSGHNEIIEEKFGPAVPWMLGNSRSMGIVNEEAVSTMEKMMDAAVKRILRKGAK